MRDMLLIVNFCDGNSRAIARKLRAERVYCKIVPGDSTPAEVAEQQPLGLVLAGATTGRDAPENAKAFLAAGLPLLALGDCAAAICQALGGTAGELAVHSAVAPVTYADEPLLSGLEDSERMLLGVRTLTLADGMRAICEAQGAVVGFSHGALPVYGMQYQIEQNDPDSMQLLLNFAQSVCGCTKWWDDEAFTSRAIEEISRVVGDGRALCAMTGGVDSGVSAMLAHRALGDRLQCLFIDTGLLRDNEGNDFMAFYKDGMGLSIKRVYAQERFLAVLRGVTAPEEKRRVIGETLQTILDEETRALGDYTALIRGTNYNDIMSGEADDYPGIRCEGLRVIEPVRELFKDEIRRVGEALGMPSAVISRQPFPGSGLALRIMGEVTERRLDVLRAADAIFRSEIMEAGQQKRLWMHFALLTPLPEGKEHDCVICLRAVHASESAQAYAARLPYDLLERVTERVMQKCPGVKRVLYDLTPSSNYQGIEWQ